MTNGVELSEEAQKTIIREARGEEDEFGTKSMFISNQEFIGSSPVYHSEKYIIIQ